MKCGHCNSYDVSVSHVKACSDNEQRIRQIGLRDLPVESPVAPAPSLAVLADTNAEIEGVYWNPKNGRYYKVQQSQLGHYYAKEWTGAVWDYEGKWPLHQLTLHHKVGAKEARQFGRVTGQCIFCSRKLTDERSIEVGYGPTCADREGLPWGE